MSTFTSKLSRGILAVATFLIAGAILSLAVMRFQSPGVRFTTPQLFILGGSVLGVFLGFFILLQRSYAREQYNLAHDKTTGLLWGVQIPKDVPKSCSAYVYIILKDYSHYLERHGLNIGDQIVRRAAETVKERLGYHGTLYRFSDSDLFFMVQEKDFNLEKFTNDLQQTIECIFDDCLDAVPDENIQIHLTLAVGIAPATHATDSETLVTYAKFAAMEASKKDSSIAEIFDFKAYLQHKAIIERRHHLPEVIEQAQLTTVFQPIISCHTGKLYGYEALTRPTNPAYKSITELLDDAEMLGIYSRLELVMTLSAIQAFRDLGGTSRLFINMAPETIRGRVYDKPIADGLFDNIKFVIEIIERGEILASIIALLTKTIANLNAMIALDDFGTGYSNHLALLNSKPDIVKVSHELTNSAYTRISYLSPEAWEPKC
jgi:EAL domain-containing protein (putative c-di-GMP-specific phosphodiesterase class I)/GGDEF domain-containing protein